MVLKKLIMNKIQEPRMIKLIHGGNSKYSLPENFPAKKKLTMINRMNTCIEN